MATTELLAPTTAAGSSAAFTVTDTPVPVAIKADYKDIGSDWISIERKTSGGHWLAVGRLTREVPALVVEGAGEYRATKRPSEHAIGADQG
ncbi:MAG: hypothetical protein QM612_09085 [Thermomonas sp.]|uniref:hypothetical protein n=1 Tax=Thermomonas sp. TaxID=1971895 RepID=UPI0039E68323